jgi:signal transduction histidine kinase
MSAYDLTNPKDDVTAFLAQRWEQLTSPSASVPSEKQQRARTLASIILALLLIASPATMILIIIARISGEILVTEPISAVGLVLVGLAYVLSRTRYHEISAYICTYVIVIAGGTLLLPGDFDLLIAASFILAPMVAGTLLEAPAVIVSAAVSCIILIGSYGLNPGTVPVSSVALMVGILVSGSGVTAYASRVRKRNVVELQAAQAALQEQVIIAQQAREHAERSDQVKSAFLASMSHELRTPLNAVINFTHFVIDGDTGPVNEQQVELLSEVVGSARHLLNLINDVLDMSKIESGSLNLFIEDDVNLEALLKTTLATGQGLLGEKPVTLRAQIDDHLPLVRADRQRILQILLNLMSNACKFTERGEIIVSARRNGPDLFITVKDTGPGIAPEDQALVFEAFKQTESGLRHSGGTGLGMPIARSLAEAHGGRLWLESEAGKGTTFFITLPVKSETLAPILALV